VCPINKKQNIRKIKCYPTKHDKGKGSKNRESLPEVGWGHVVQGKKGEECGPFTVEWEKREAATRVQIKTFGLLVQFLG